MRSRLATPMKVHLSGLESQRLSGIALNSNRLFCQRCAKLSRESLAWTDGVSKKSRKESAYWSGERLSVYWTVERLPCVSSSPSWRRPIPAPGKLGRQSNGSLSFSQVIVSPFAYATAIGEQFLFSWVKRNRLTHTKKPTGRT